MPVALDEACAEAALEEVAVEPVPAVEQLGIRAIEALHPLRQVGRRRLEEEVVVVRHQALRMAVPAEPGDDVFRDREHQPPVGVVAHDVLSAVSAGVDVVHAVLDEET